MGTSKDIYEVLYKYTQKVTAKAAQLIADDLTETARIAIEDFYNDYTPKYYKRHYDNFRKNSYKRYYKNQHGKIFVGGVNLTPDNMENIYHYSPELVHESVYFGFHGLPIEGTPVMYPSPLHKIIYKYQDIYYHQIDEYIEKAQKIVG